MSETTIEKSNEAAASCCPSTPKSTDKGVVARVISFAREQTAWTVTGAGFLALIFIDSNQSLVSLKFVGDALVQIFPFLAFAIGLAAYAKASGADGLIARVFSGRLALMIVAAALFGGLSPFCSCGVIPIIAALLSMGVPLPAVMAFWLSSPLMDPSMFVLTAATLGSAFAISKTIAAIAIGMLGGYLTWMLQNMGMLGAPLRDGVGDGGCGAGSVRNPKAVQWKVWQESERVQNFAKEAKATTFFLGKWLTIAFFLESLMLAYVSADVIAGVLGADSIWAIPTAAVVGVPAYLNGYAALPLVSGLIDMGVSPGAGMTFLISGGMTSIPAAIAVFALVKKPVFSLYVFLALAGGTLAGLSFQFFVV